MQNMAILQFSLTLLLTFVIFAGGSELKPEGRIINGSPVDIARHAYVVSLRYRRNSESGYLHECAGAIYSPSCIVTVAQCLTDIEKDTKLMVVGGANTRNGTDGLMYPVKNWVFHPKFNSFTADYDIGVVFLDTPLDLKYWSMRTIPIRPERPAPGRDGIVMGWGYRQEWGPSSFYLEQINVPVLTLDECNHIYGRNEVTERMICAGDVANGGRDACQGDTGGPLVVDEQLVGLVSWGRGCGRPGYPTVYTFVASLKSWIDETISAAEKL